MDATLARDDCRQCPGRIVCRCLKVTEEALLSVLGPEGPCSLKEIRQRTGAGDGCTACHRLLHRYLERQGEPALAQPSSSPSPI